MRPTHAALEEPVRLHRMVSAVFVLKVVDPATLCVTPPSYVLHHVSMVCAVKSMKHMRVNVTKGGPEGHATGGAVTSALPAPVRMEELALTILGDQCAAAGRASEVTYARPI